MTKPSKVWNFSYFNQAASLSWVWLFSAAPPLGFPVITQVPESRDLDLLRVIERSRAVPVPSCTNACFSKSSCPFHMDFWAQTWARVGFTCPRGCTHGLPRREKHAQNPMHFLGPLTQRCIFPLGFGARKHSGRFFVA